ncbi:hypothetical protein [Pseudanabaena sp. FACHB-2040]|uniref:hypothetical protein n=1 Tax=Pseudanabaena sp. FACHB-2040 TaxID=2692859 RepID=UPI0016883568|nr:hypothetical protein [Pseudanabaena sp. FACHB-2040]MBD2261099.1 hypothetical protein [Pseudanabaena sp. FACHB-2040]
MNHAFDMHLMQANQRLKADKLGITIQRRKNSLFIRAVFPPKPSSKRTDYHQQSMATGFKAEVASLRIVEEAARRIAAHLASKTFDWTNYGITPVKTNTEKTIAEWIEDLEVAYFQKRQRTSTKEETWKRHYWKYLMRLPQDQILTVDQVHQVIIATEPDSLTRSYLCLACMSLCKLAGFDVEFIKELKGSYSSSKPAPRELPSDEEIVRSIYQIPYRPWQWAAGMIATYGLRPHEVFSLDLTQWPWVEVTEGTKTDWRWVPPLYSEWIEEFNLSLPQFPNVNGIVNSDFGRHVGTAFRRYKLPFRPYDLRHAWAVRAITFNIPVSMAAKWMGHSITIHTKTYQAWISKSTEEGIYNKLTKQFNESL